LLKGHDNFHAEKDEVLLPTARKSAAHFTASDTSARHQGRSAFAPTLQRLNLLVSAQRIPNPDCNFLRAAVAQPEEQYRLCEKPVACLEFSGIWRQFRSKVDGLEDGIWTAGEAWQKQLAGGELTNETPTAVSSAKRLCSANY